VRVKEAIERVALSPPEIGKTLFNEVFCAKGPCRDEMSLRMSGVGRVIATEGQVLSVGGDIGGSLKPR